MLSQKFGHVLVILFFVTWISLICEKKSICKMPLKKQMKKKFLKWKKNTRSCTLLTLLIHTQNFMWKVKIMHECKNVIWYLRKKKRHISDYVKIAKFEKKLNQPKRNDFFWSKIKNFDRNYLILFFTFSLFVLIDLDAAEINFIHFSFIRYYAQYLLFLYHRNISLHFSQQIQ